MSSGLIVRGWNEAGRFFADVYFEGFLVGGNELGALGLAMSAAVIASAVDSCRTDALNGCQGGVATSAGPGSAMRLHDQIGSLNLPGGIQSNRPKQEFHV